MSTTPRDPRPSGRPPRPKRGRRSASPDEDPVRLTESLASVSAQLGAGPAGAVGTIFGRWEQIVGSVVAGHVRPLRLDSDTLVVGVDHPAWVTQIHHLAPTILERLSEACGEDEAPRQLQVRVLR
ncbi:MAG: DUF721 domain-containing protein [Acidimicrobiales bacterium]